MQHRGRMVNHVILMFDHLVFPTSNGFGSGLDYEQIIRESIASLLHIHWHTVVVLDRTAPTSERLGVVVGDGQHSAAGICQGA